MLENTPPEIRQQLAKLSESDCKSFFRAVSTSNGRKALKLEKPFWAVLEEICMAENTSLGELILLIEDASLSEKNLASAVRQFALEWNITKIQNMQKKLSSTSLKGLLEASTSPAFAISPSKALHSYNHSFLKYIRSNLPSVHFETIGSSLRLQLDIGIEELTEKLEAADNKPIMLGFAIGANERRIRGRVNTVQAPFWPGNMILGFVVD